MKLIAYTILGLALLKTQASSGKETTEKSSMTPQKENTQKEKTKKTKKKRSSSLEKKNKTMKGVNAKYKNSCLT